LKRKSGGKGGYLGGRSLLHAGKGGRREKKDYEKAQRGGIRGRDSG